MRYTGIMKCVIIALALLCSAQALKMDRPAISERRMKRDAIWDKSDKKRGRPLRSKMTHKQRRAAGKERFMNAERFKGATQATVSQLNHATSSNVMDFFNEYNDGDLEMCAWYANDDEEALLCAGDYQASGDAGLDDAFCAEVDDWNTVAAEIIDAVLSECLEDFVAGAVEDVLTVAMKGAKRAPFQPEAVAYDISFEYFDAYDIIDFVDNALGSYSFYCDQVVGNANAEWSDNSGATANYDKDGSDLDAEALGMADDDLDTKLISGPNGMGKLGDFWKDAYDATQTKGDNVFQKKFGKMVKGHRQRWKNYHNWRKGTFRRMAHS